MTLTLNNPSIFNAAYDGALAGLLAGSGLTGIAATDNTATSYATASSIANAFATYMDQTQITSAITHLSASNATIVQATAAEGGTQLALPLGMFGLCFAYWFQRSGAAFTQPPSAVVLPATYAAACAAIAAQFTEAQAAFAAAGSLT